MTAKHAVLKKYYGYDNFRPGQEEVIDAQLSGRDVLAIMPTGAGKSICFQIPALLMEGITLIISPLISLMKDQVMQLVQMGIAGAYFNSSLTPRQYQIALERAKAGRYKLIYVAPERLNTPAFQSFVQTAHIAMVAVDEAHCISQWGQDFRPAYLQLPQFIESLPERPVLSAFTATATKQVQEDICRLLHLQNPYTLITGFDRKNLYFEVRRPKEKERDAQVLSIVKEHTGENGIIYCATRKNVETVCAMLQEHEIPATRYHAGLEAAERLQNQEDFLYDRASVMVATNAFGMGIDKPDVRYIVHYNMPRDLEGYYQEAGRAGRDGEPADCILLYHWQDVGLHQFLMTHSKQNEELTQEQAAQLRERDQERLKQMTFYCTTDRCLRQFLLQYFNEKAPSACGNCSNCLRIQQKTGFTEMDRVLVKCVSETEERYGIQMILKIVLGEEDERIERSRLYEKESYGKLSHCTYAEVRRAAQELIDRQVLQIVTTTKGYPILCLGKQSQSVFSLPKKILQHIFHGSAQKQHTALLSAQQQRALLQELYTVRAAIARKKGIPAAVIFMDTTLRQMCQRVPRTFEELCTIQGVGQHKAEQYGPIFLDAIQAFLSKKQ